MVNKIACITLYNELVRLQQAYRNLSWIKRLGFRLTSWSLASALANLEPTNVASAQHLFFVQKNVWALKKLWLLKKAFTAFTSEDTFFYKLFNQFSPIPKEAAKPTTISILTHPKADTLLSLSLKFGVLKHAAVIQPLLNDDPFLHFVQETFDKSNLLSATLLTQLTTHQTLESIKPGLKFLLHFGLNSHINVVTLMNSGAKQQLLTYSHHTKSSVEKTLALNDSLAEEFGVLLAQISDFSEHQYQQLLQTTTEQRQLLLELSAVTTISLSLLDGLTVERMQLYRTMLQLNVASQDFPAHLETIQSLENPAEQVSMTEQYQKRPILFNAYPQDVMKVLLAPPFALKKFIHFIEVIDVILKTSCTDEQCKLFLDFFNALDQEESKQYRLKATS